MSSPQLEICEKCGLQFYSILGETICPKCEKKEENEPQGKKEILKSLKKWMYEVCIPKKKIEIKNKTNNSGTWFELELTDDDIKKLKYSFKLIGVEIKESK